MGPVEPMRGGGERSGGLQEQAGTGRTASDDSGGSFVRVRARAGTTTSGVGPRVVAIRCGHGDRCGAHWTVHVGSGSAAGRRSPSATHRGRAGQSPTPVTRRESLLTLVPTNRASSRGGRAGTGGRSASAVRDGARRRRPVAPDERLGPSGPNWQRLAVASPDHTVAGRPRVAPRSRSWTRLRFLDRSPAARDAAAASDRSGLVVRVDRRPPRAPRPGRARR